MDVSTELLVEDADRENELRQVHSIGQFASRMRDRMGLRLCVIENVDRLRPAAQEALADHFKRCQKVWLHCYRERSASARPEPSAVATSGQICTSSKGKQVKKSPHSASRTGLFAQGYR